MKRLKWLVVVLMVLLIPVAVMAAGSVPDQNPLPGDYETPANRTAENIFSGSEADLYKAPDKAEAANVEFDVTVERVIVKIRIWGMTDGKDTEVRGIEKMVGKTIYVHSKYFNEQNGEQQNVIAKTEVDHEGWITFQQKNPCVSIGKGKPFRDRYWMTTREDDKYPYIPESEYTFLDNSGNPAIEVIYREDRAEVVPSDFSKDHPDKWGILPSEIYTESEEKIKIQNY